MTDLCDECREELERRIQTVEHQGTVVYCSHHHVLAVATAVDGYVTDVEYSTLRRDP
jgi:hypothetical protein